MAKLGDMPEASLDDVPFEDALYYACRDADGTARVKAQLWPRVQAMGLEDVYRLELDTYHLIDRMMMVGIKPDLQHFADLSFKLQGEIEDIQYRLEKAIGRENFNANSYDQVADYLFQTLALPSSKRTPSGGDSTNDIILEGLEKEYGLTYPVISDIREYRESYKLKNTFCVAPATRVLTSSLRWVPIGQLAKGDTLVGFNENTRRGRGNDHHRHWRESRVLKTRRVKKPCYRLVFDDGTEIVCSTDHRWLCRSTSSFEKAVWVRSDELCLEDRPKQTRHEWEIIKPANVWEEDNDYTSGYLAGVFDGEGCLHRPRYGMRLDFAQKQGAVLEQTKSLLTGNGFHFTGDNRRISHLNIPNAAEVMRFLGSYRPVRLLGRFEQYIRENKLPRMKMATTVKLISREYIGEQEVVALETSTHTFLAEGLASHNCDRIPDFVHRWPRDGRVHATFRTTRVVTGRLAASDPNLLAQPEHGKWAKDFKRGWVAEEGRVLGAWDESQIELRVLAHLSRDEVLLKAYRNKVDLHATLAQRIFGGTLADHKKGTKRLAAKAINFGIPMGMQAQGLCLQLKKNGLTETDEDDAQRWLDETSRLYAGVERYKTACIAEARRHGFIRCLSGRIRYIGGIRSWDRATRAEAERYSFSTKIQEGAQWIMKKAEAAVWHDVIRPLHRAGYWIEPLMQVHDALKLEMEERLAHDMHPMMVWAMTKAVDGMLCVPLAVEGEWGRNFADMESFT